MHIEKWHWPILVVEHLELGVEEDIYAKNETKKGGFRGIKSFVVDKKVKESDVITSFYLKPQDGSVAPSFTAGQYIALTLTVPEEANKITRNYSLSESSNENYLRISVKREEGTPNGISSLYLHER